MRAYRATLMVDVVAQAEDATAALETIERTARMIGLPYRIERLTWVRDDAALPADPRPALEAHDV